MILIGFISLGCTMVLPALRRSRYYDKLNHFLLSLAVGTLAGDALIHLLPHVRTMNTMIGHKCTCNIKHHLCVPLFGNEFKSYPI